MSRGKRLSHRIAHRAMELLEAWGVEYTIWNAIESLDPSCKFIELEVDDSDWPKFVDAVEMAEAESIMEDYDR